jgi:hypothetical protein
MKRRNAVLISQANRDTDEIGKVLRIMHSTKWKSRECSLPGVATRACFLQTEWRKGLWHTVQGELQFRAEAAASQGKQQARRSQDNSENIAGSLSPKPS